MPRVTIGVFDENNQAPLTNAKVFLDSSSVGFTLTGYTKSDGLIVFPLYNRPIPNTRKVTVSLKGYRTVTRVMDGSQVYQDIFLEPVEPIVTARVYTPIPTQIPTIAAIATTESQTTFDLLGQIDIFGTIQTLGIIFIFKAIFGLICAIILLIFLAVIGYAAFIILNRYFRKNPRLKKLKMPYVNNLRAQIQHQNEQLQKIEKELTHTPSDSTIYNNKGITLFSLGELVFRLAKVDKTVNLSAVVICYKEAIKAFYKSISLNKNDADVWNNLGLIYREQTRYQDALKSVENALTIDPANTKARCNKGVIQFCLHQYEDSRVSLNKCISSEENNAEALQFLGRICGANKNFSEALQYIKQSLDVDPTDDESWLLKGGVLEDEVWSELIPTDPINEEFNSCIRQLTPDENNRLNQAITALEKSVTLNPGNIDAWISLGRLYRSHLHYHEVVDTMEDILLLDEKMVPALCEKGEALSALRKNREALKSYDKALAFNSPLRGFIFSDKGFVYLKCKKNQKALEMFEESLKIIPKDIHALRGKGQALAALRKYQDALNVWNDLLKISQQNPFLLCEKGRAFHGLHLYDDAVTCYDEALIINPNNIIILNEKGRTLFAQHKFSAGLICYKRIISIKVTELSEKYKEKGIEKLFEWSVDSIVELITGERADRHKQ